MNIEDFQFSLMTLADFQAEFERLKQIEDKNLQEALSKIAQLRRLMVQLHRQNWSEEFAPKALNLSFQIQRYIEEI